jgi:hypothetical protein
MRLRHFLSSSLSSSLKLSGGMLYLFKTSFITQQTAATPSTELYKTLRSLLHFKSIDRVSLRECVVRRCHCRYAAVLSFGYVLVLRTAWSIANAGLCLTGHVLSHGIFCDPPFPSVNLLHMHMCMRTRTRTHVPTQMT